MNCLTALERLDLCRADEAILYDPLGNELRGAAFDEAALHVQSCPACQAAIRRSEKFDERIGQLTRDVLIPAGLRERLLARLESEPAAAELASPAAAAQPPAVPSARQPAVSSAGQPAGRSRRRVTIAAVAASMLLALGVGVWKLAISHPTQLSMDEIARSALSAGITADNLPEFRQFQGGLAVPLPKTTTKLPHPAPFRRLVDPQLGDREIAIYFFTLVGRNGRKFAGRLVVVPTALVKDLPAATSFLEEAPVYNRGYCTTAWVEGKFAYLCCVHEGGEGELHLLRPARNDAA